MKKNILNPTVRDVAKLAGVSAPTVSRVLNGGPASATATRAVEAAVHAIGYRADSAAATLRRGRSRKIGLVTPTLSNPTYTVTIQAAHDLLREHGYQLVLGNTYGELQEEIQVLRMMRHERVCGLIVNTSEGEDDGAAQNLFAGMIAQGTPVVFLGRGANGLDADSLSINNGTALRQVVSYLIRTGRAAPGFIAGDETIMAARERREGFALALRERGLPCGPCLCNGAFTVQNGEGLAVRLLASHTLDALVCGNDLMAVGAIQAAARLGRRVPDDLAVVGFDDIELASLVTPRLTTVRQPFGAIVETTCHTLLDRVEGRLSNRFRDLRLEAELIVRESA